jgi:hypothetical protein
VVAVLPRGQLACEISRACLLENATAEARGHAATGGKKERGGRLFLLPMPRVVVAGRLLLVALPAPDVTSSACPSRGGCCSCAHDGELTLRY